jgi:peptidoglycan/xylan/chitin deacetylase (PgdA/CDA1 family)
MTDPSQQGSSRIPARDAGDRVDSGVAGELPAVAALRARCALVLAFPSVVRGPALGAAWITAAQLERQLDALLRAGVRMLNFEEFVERLLAAAAPSRPEALVSFDHPGGDFLELAWPLLQARAIQPLIFVSTGQVGRTQRRGPNTGFRQVQSIAWAELEGLVARGATVQCQGHCGADLTRLPAEIAFGDLMRSRREIEKRLGVEPIALGYPAGAANAEVAELAVKAGFQMGFLRGARWRTAERLPGLAALLLPRRPMGWMQSAPIPGRTSAAAR